MFFMLWQRSIQGQEWWSVGLSVSTQIVSDNLKNEDKPKNEDDLKNEDNLKKGDNPEIKDGLKLEKTTSKMKMTSNKDNLENQEGVPGPSLHYLSCACLKKSYRYVSIRTLNYISSTSIAKLSSSW